MRHCRRAHPLQRARGLTLIELLVSITIGLVVVVAALSTYIGSAAAGRMAEAQGRMNEDAQTALAILTQHLRMAGNNPIQPNRVNETRRNPVYAASVPAWTATSTFTLTYTITPTAFSVRGCDGTFSDITTATPTFADLTCTATGTTTLPDSIAVHYEADRFNTIPTAANGPTDCLGSALPIWTANLTALDLPLTTPATTTPVDVTYTVADNRFYVWTPQGTTAPSLYCKGNGGGALATPQPLVENVDDLQFEYGLISAAAPTASIAGYLTAAQLANPTDASLAALTPDARWQLVRAIRICVVVRSEGQVVSDAASARYVGCNGNEVTPPDRRLRRAYTTTVVMRNRE